MKQGHVFPQSVTRRISALRTKVHKKCVFALTDVIRKRFNRQFVIRKGRVCFTARRRSAFVLRKCTSNLSRRQRNQQLQYIHHEPLTTHLNSKNESGNIQQIEEPRRHRTSLPLSKLPSKATSASSSACSWNCSLLFSFCSSWSSSLHLGTQERKARGRSRRYPDHRHNGDHYRNRHFLPTHSVLKMPQQSALLELLPQSRLAYPCSCFMQILRSLFHRLLNVLISINSLPLLSAFKRPMCAWGSHHLKKRRH